jgi:crotonobetainyl-CoA:carnitine CoA-transferase CaiB-like acyl-CoA transferase
MARLLTGQVEDLAEPPLRAVGEQSAFIAGLAAASAGMAAALGAHEGAIVDVSKHEALATLAMSELTRAGLTGVDWSRRRAGDGNGATVTILPASDGYVAISPREEKQWASWLAAMGSPAWGADPRFARKPDRVKHWDALHALMSEWSRRHDKHWIAATAQKAHVPSFPLCEVGEHLRSPQLAHRRFFRAFEHGGRQLSVPGSPFGCTLRTAPPKPLACDRKLPLSGVRVLDFSWVIAGPTTTRYLAAMGADVIKVEAPGAGDPARQSELHTVLGQAKRAIVLDLKRPEGLEAARALAARSDILIENYASGVMDRLGMGADALADLNPQLIYVSASGMGRTGPQARAVAYGTLLQSYTGFAGLNRHPGTEPRIGFAWCDPMCALMLSFVAAAALRERERTGRVARIDFSMIEAMLWTMAAPVIATQIDGPPQPMGNAAADCFPHGAYRCRGDDAWISLATADDTQWRALCGLVPALASHAACDITQRRAAQAFVERTLAEWAGTMDAQDAEARLAAAGVPAAALAHATDLVHCEHLRARGFWTAHGEGVLPGLPWSASFGRAQGPAPRLGADTEAVLREVLGYAPERIDALRSGGVLG